jgi:hypothetical protein
MRRATFIAIIFLLLTLPAGGATYAFIGATNGNAVNGRYYNVDDFDPGGTSEAVHRIYVTSDTTLTTLYVWASADPGGAASWTITVYKDGVATAQSATIAAGTTSAIDSDDVSVSADSGIDVKITSSGTPAAARIGWSITYTSTVQYFGAYSSSLTTSARYLNLKGSNSSTSNTTRFVCPFALTLRRLHCDLSVAPGAGATRTFTIQKAGVATALLRTFGEADSGIKADDANSVVCAAGDDIRMACSATGTPAAANITFWLDSTPGTADNFALTTGSYATSSVLSNTVENYMSVNGELENPTATIANVDFWSSPITVTALYAILNAAPDNGAGTQSFTVALFEEDVASVLSVAIEEAATTGNDTDAGITIEEGHKIAIGFTPSGTPIATDVPRGVALCAQIAAAGGGGAPGAVSARRHGQ